jgi:pimeloyl-ACP methyl ester carboxylesterase
MSTPPPNPLMQHQAKLLEQCAPQPRPADAENLPIHVTTWGEGGEPVLIVHGGVQGGLGGGPSTFSRQKALADHGWLLRLVDRPGFGASPTRGPDDMEADAPWIAELLGDGAHLIGHSWGGAEALLAAARRPEAVWSLILVEPALQPLLMTAEGEDYTAAKADAMRSLGPLLATRTPAEYGLAFARSLGRAPDGGPNRAAAVLESDSAKADQLGSALLRSRMAPPPVLARAAAVLAAARTPVLVITGGWSPFFDGVGVRTAELTGGHHEVVRAPDHFPQETAATAFNEVVDAFMRQHRGRSA